MSGQAAPAGQDQAQDPEYRGWVIIEWPQARPPGPDYPAGAMLPGWGISLFDAMTGRPMNTVSKVAVHAGVDGLITADLTMFATPDGEPVQPPAEGRLVLYPDIERGTGFLEATFTFMVAAMRTRGSYPAAAGGGSAGAAGSPGCGGGGGGGGGSVHGDGGAGGAGGNAGAPGCAGGGAGV